MLGQTGPVAGPSGGMSKVAKGQGPAEKEEQAGNQKRARRQWESWSAEDKNSFFEGLYEVSLKSLDDRTCPLNARYKWPLFYPIFLLFLFKAIDYSKSQRLSCIFSPVFAAGYKNEGVEKQLQSKQGRLEGLANT